MQIKEKKEIVDIKNLSGGLEILVQLAEKGEIDPWDVDIIDVTSKYLALLDKSPRENLLNAGRAIFFASVLLRLKSDILLNLSNETLLLSQQTDNFFPEDELLLQEDGPHLDLSRLESFLIRSSINKQQRKRKISLGDLIFALQQAEEEEERRALRAKLKASQAHTIIAPETPDDLLEITQEEDLEDSVEKIEVIIQEHLTDEKPITLSFLAELLNSKTKPFIALLFLAHSQKVVLEQREMYSEVFIYKGGTVLEENVTAMGRDGETAKEDKKKAKKKKKKGVIDKLKEKISGKNNEPKVIEVTTDGDEVIDLTVKTEDKKEVTNIGNGNGNNTESGEHGRASQELGND